MRAAQAKPGICFLPTSFLVTILYGSPVGSSTTDRHSSLQHLRMLLFIAFRSSFFPPCMLQPGALACFSLVTFSSARLGIAFSTRRSLLTTSEQIFVLQAFLRLGIAASHAVVRVSMAKLTVSFRSVLSTILCLHVLAASLFRERQRVSSCRLCQHPSFGLGGT